MKPKDGLLEKLSVEKHIVVLLDMKPQLEDNQLTAISFDMLSWGQRTYHDRSIPIQKVKYWYRGFIAAGL